MHPPAPLRTRDPRLADALPAELGEVIGGYRLDALIARGGMGCVFSATHVKLGRRAAVKVLYDSLALDQSYVQRFFTEARVVNEVRHPNIVDVFDFVESEAPRRVAFVMELLEGLPLSALTRWRRLSVRQSVNLALQLADTLEAVHSIGVVHRDLKPDNIVVIGNLENDLSELPSLKVLDFGIAKASNLSVTQTAPGSILGTPAYAAPEQLIEGAVSPAADIYAVGAIIYEMTAGERLFTGEIAAVLRAKLIGTQPEIVLPTGVVERERITELVRACTALDPLARPTLSEVRASLASIAMRLGSVPPEEPVLLTRRKHPSPPAPPPTMREAMLSSVPGVSDVSGVSGVSSVSSWSPSITSIETALVRRPRLAMFLGIAFLALASAIVATATRARLDPPVIIQPLGFSTSEAAQREEHLVVPVDLTPEEREHMDQLRGPELTAQRPVARGPAIAEPPPHPSTIEAVPQKTEPRHTARTRVEKQAQPLGRDELPSW